MMLNQLFENINLVPYHNALCLMGSFLAVWCAQLFGREVFGPESCWTSRTLRWVSMLVIALAFLWSLSYAQDKHWQPWPPDLFTIIGINLYLVSTIIAAANHRRALG